MRKLNVSEQLHEKQIENEKKGIYDKHLELTTNGNVNGLMIEPLNPSHSITKKYYLDHDTRKQILGKLNTLRRPKEDKKKADAVNDLLKNLGMPTLDQINTLKRNCEKLLKEKERLEDDRNSLMSAKSMVDLNTIKKQLEILEEEREKQKMLEKGIKPPETKKDGEEIINDKGDPLTTYKAGYSMVNGLIDHLYKIKKRSKVHMGYQVRRYLFEDSNLYNQISHALTNFGIPADIVANEIQRAKLKARYLKSLVEKVPRSLQMGQSPFINNNPQYFNRTQYQQPPQMNVLEIMANVTKGLDDKKNKEIEEANKYAKDNAASTKPRQINTQMPDIEHPSQFFEKTQGTYGVINFGMRYEPEGLNLIKDYQLINYKFNITTLLEMKFRPEEKLTSDVIYTYLEHTPKNINHFNFDIKSVLLGFNEITDPTHTKLKKILKKLKSNDFKKAHMIKKRIKRIESKASIELKYKTDEIIKKIEKKKIQRLKGVAKHHKKVVAEHHVDKPHYKRNFGSIADFFVHMFGS